MPYGFIQGQLQPEILSTRCLAVVVSVLYIMLFKFTVWELESGRKIYGQLINLLIFLPFYIAMEVVNQGGAMG